MEALRWCWSHSPRWLHAFSLLRSGKPQCCNDSQLLELMPIFPSWQVPDGEGLDLVWALPGRRRQGLSAVGEMRYGISSRALLGTADQPHQDLKKQS